MVPKSQKHPKDWTRLFKIAVSKVSSIPSTVIPPRSRSRLGKICQSSTMLSSGWDISKSKVCPFLWGGSFYVLMQAMWVKDLKKLCSIRFTWLVDMNVKVSKKYRFNRRCPCDLTNKSFKLIKEFAYFQTISFWRWGTINRDSQSPIFQIGTQACSNDGVSIPVGEFWIEIHDLWMSGIAMVLTKYICMHLTLHSKIVSMTQWCASFIVHSCA